MWILKFNILGILCHKSSSVILSSGKCRPIPLNSLRQWILGLPGDATDYKLDDQYRLSEITYSQNGKNWKVVYGGYDTKTQPAMPANMELTDGGQRIKLKMDNWIVK